MTIKVVTMWISTAHIWVFFWQFHIKIYIRILKGTNQILDDIIMNQWNPLRGRLSVSVTSIVRNNRITIKSVTKMEGG